MLIRAARELKDRRQPNQLCLRECPKGNEAAKEPCDLSEMIVRTVAKVLTSRKMQVE